MSALICTLDHDAVTLTVDSALAIYDQRVAMPATTAAALGDEPLAAQPAPVRVVHVEKLLKCERRRYMTAGAGFWPPYAGWGWAALDERWRDVDELAAAAPELLAEALAAAPEHERALTVVLAGWSASKDAPAAWAYVSGEGFTPHELVPGAVTMTPPLMPDDPAWGFANAVDTVEARHLVLVRAQARRAREATAGPSPIAGSVWSATIGRGGMSYGKIGRL